MTAHTHSAPPGAAVSSQPTPRKRAAAALVIVLAVAAGTVIGDRFLPFRGSGESYARSCDGMLATFDMGFIPRTTFTGRRIMTSAFDESGEGEAYQLDCTVYGDGEEQLQARARVTTSGKDAWQKDLEGRGRLAEPVKALSVAAGGDVAATDAAGFSGASGAAYYLPCELSGGKSVHLSVSVEAPGAPDGDADDQRLAIAAVAAGIARHSLTELGCGEPLTAPAQSPAFAS